MEFGPSLVVRQENSAVAISPTGTIFRTLYWKRGKSNRANGYAHHPLKKQVHLFRHILAVREVDPLCFANNNRLPIGMDLKKSGISMCEGVNKNLGRGGQW
jgi:hypothetical protein